MRRVPVAARALVVAGALAPCLSDAASAVALAPACGAGSSAPYRQNRSPSTQPAPQALLPANPLQLSPSTPAQPLVPIAPFDPSPGLPSLPDLTTPQNQPAQPVVTIPPVSLPSTPSTPTALQPPASNPNLGTRATKLTPTFSDNFSNGIDPAKWGYNYPWSDACNGTGNADATQYAAYANPSCGSQAGAGVFSTGANGLDIAIKPTPGGIDASGKPYVTGQLYSKAAQLYGYFEMTATLPATKGVGAAFWLMPQDGSWPPELDVMENLGQDPNTVYGTIHDTNSPQQQVVSTVAGGVQVPHTYAVDWEASTTTFYTDGKATQSFATPDSMKKPMYMILSVNSSPPGHTNWG